jgi:hypothetical protein
MSWCVASLGTPAPAAENKRLIELCCPRLPSLQPLLLKFQKEGLFSHISLSETRASTLRKAAAVRRT